MKGFTKMQICKKNHRSGPQVSLGTVLDAKQNFLKISGNCLPACIPICSRGRRYYVHTSWI